MKISIVIPFFNEEDSLLKTLCAINDQTHKAEEVIFVDSGSTDNSKKIITEYSKLHKELNKEIYFYQQVLKKIMELIQSLLI